MLNFISTLYHFDMFQPSKGHPQRLWPKHFSRKFNKMSHQM